MARDMKKPRSGGSSSKGSSLFTGLLLGLIVGIAAAVGVAFYVNRGASPFGPKSSAADPAIPPTQPPARSAPEVLRPTPGKDEVAAPTVAPTTETASTPATAPRRASGADRFDFYTMLPGQSGKEVRPAESKKVEASAPAAKKAWLQAGAFQNEQDADNLKAKLALIGIEARIQTQEIPGKGLWHRVRVGPFSQPADLDKARAQLQGNGIESTVVKSD